MELSHAWIDNNLVITVPQKQLNFNIGLRLKHVFTENSTPQPANIILDLSQVEKIDSSGLAGLIFCYKCLQGKGQLRVCGRNDHIRQMMEMTGVGQLFPHCDTVEEALSELSPH